MPLVRDYEITSQALAGKRRVTVYLPQEDLGSSETPVVFFADGQTVGRFSERVHEEIAKGRLPSLILIGLHSCEEIRVGEYVEGIDDGLFAAHEQLFTKEILRWAHSELDIEPKRERCGVFGFSNGGAFAIAMGFRHPEQYGVVIAFSMAGGIDRTLTDADFEHPFPRFYLSAGNREKPVRNRTRSLAKWLTKNGAQARYTERFGTHDFAHWTAELPEALHWAFCPEV